MWRLPLRPPPGQSQSSARRFRLRLPYVGVNGAHDVRRGAPTPRPPTAPIPAGGAELGACNQAQAPAHGFAGSVTYLAHVG